MTMALRGYLRFLGALGLCRAGLEQAVPTIPQWRLSALPRYIGVAEVERLIATCDLTTPAGVRDRAILLLLARLGLRAGDILALRLDDIDWQQATLTVRGKGRRETRLPLPSGCGRRRARLPEARPAPRRPRGVVPHLRMLRSGRCAARPSRASFGVRWKVGGIAAPTKGANLLRHSAATAMLRGGATLDMIGAVLRHRSPDTTAHYAKVDIVMLQQIAQPWPGDA